MRATVGIAESLARYRVRQGRQDEARQILAPVCNQFTEGFATDLRFPEDDTRIAAFSPGGIRALWR